MAHRSLTYWARILLLPLSIGLSAPAALALVPEETPPAAGIKGAALQVPGPIQVPGAIQKAGEIQAPRGNWQVPGPIQVPGAIQVPTGPWQVPGEIQVPHGIQAVRTEAATCTVRISLVADALFDFDKSTLRADAAETLAAAAPEIAKAGKHKITIAGHTDAVGTDAYNDKLSVARARSVRDWLSAKSYVPQSTEIKGWGKRKPIAPNSLADGRDNPSGRQQNRRVEIEIATCDRPAR